ncbi:hypothetical protein ADL21_28460 [Streptomyces albus subsp. albus]|nr:hypothetical protein ADL21_28460 [Streptomyces albus subsp. albus]
MLRHLPPRVRRALTAVPALALSVAAVCALLSGCDGTGKPRSAGHTVAAAAPERLWPGRPLPPPLGKPDDPPKPVPLRSVPRVPSGDIRRVTALAVARAAVEDTGSTVGWDATTKGIKECRAIGREPCPVLAPHYRDLNGDGKEELLLGVEAEQRFLLLWAFTVKDGVITKVLDDWVRPLSVEVSGHDVTVREAAEKGGYDLRKVYSWDGRLQAMKERITEYVESGRGK